MCHGRMGTRRREWKSPGPACCEGHVPWQNGTKATHLRFPKPPGSWTDSPLSFLLRVCGLEDREHSEPLFWQGTHPSSSSPSTQRVPEKRHVWQGAAAKAEKDVDSAVCRLLGPISNLCELPWRRGGCSGRGGLGAMAIGAVRWTEELWAMEGGRAGVYCACAYFSCDMAVGKSWAAAPQAAGAEGPVRNAIGRPGASDVEAKEGHELGAQAGPVRGLVVGRRS